MSSSDNRATKRTPGEGRQNLLGAAAGLTLCEPGWVADEHAPATGHIFRDLAVIRATDLNATQRHRRVAIPRVRQTGDARIRIELALADRAFLEKRCAHYSRTSLDLYANVENRISSLLIQRRPQHSIPRGTFAVAADRELRDPLSVQSKPRHHWALGDRGCDFHTHAATKA